MKITEQDIEVIEAIKDKITKQDGKIKRLAKARAKRYYLSKINKGDWSTYVPEFEGSTVSRYQKLKDKKEIILMENRNVEFEVEVSLTKGFNRVAINARKVNEADLSYVEDKCVAQVRELWAVIPHSDDTSKKPTVSTQARETIKKDTYEKVEYTAPDRVTTKFAKGKQVGLLEQGIKKGLFTTQQVNAIGSWDETQEFIKKVFASK